MLNGLVPVSIVTHIHDLHFADFMNHLSVVGIIEDGGHHEDRIKHGYKRLLSAHQIDQSLYIVKDRPGIVPAVPFGKSIAPFKRAKWFLEGSVLISSAHQAGFLVKNILIILRPFGKDGNFIFGLAQGFSKFINAKIGKSIFEGTGYIFIYLHIVRDIAQLIIIINSKSSYRMKGTFIFRIFQNSFPKSFNIVAPSSFEVSIGNECR